MSTTPAPRRKRGTTREMMRDPLGLTKTETKVLDGIVGPAPALDNGFRPLWPAPIPGSFEVVREHAATCRVQLAGWDILDEAKAERLAATLNARTVAAGGVTLASSGLLERGWVYSARRAT